MTALHPPIRDDRILPITRVLAALVVLLLGLGVWILHVQPDRTYENLFWKLRPRITVLALGTGYMMGLYYWGRVLIARRWNRVAAGFLPIIAFCIVIDILTIVLLPGLDVNHPSFWIWSGIYAFATIAVPLVWWLNRPRSSGQPEQGDLIIARPVRLAARAAGALVVGGGLLTCLLPDWIIPLWAWPLSAPTAQLLCCWIILAGVGVLSLSYEPRWSGWRVFLEAGWVANIFMLLTVARAWQDIDQSRLLAWPFVTALAAAALILPAAYGAVEWQRRRQFAGSRATA